MRIFNCFNDRLVLQEIFDEISSKFISPHNIRRMAIFVAWAIFYCCGGLVLTAFVGNFIVKHPSHSFLQRSTPTKCVCSLMNDVHSGWLICHWYSCTGGCFLIGRITEILADAYWVICSIKVCWIILHVCRVYLTGGFKKPREVTWITGVDTGYSLPYDHVGYWALRIVSGVPDCIPVIGTTLVELITSFILVEAYHHSSGIDIGVSICSIRYPQQQYKCRVIKVSVKVLELSSNEPIPLISSEDREEAWIDLVTHLSNPLALYFLAFVLILLV